MVRSALQNNLWWMKDKLATGVEDQNDPLAMPQCPEHNLGRNKTIANEGQVNTGLLVTFTNHIAIRTYDINSQSGSTIAITFQQKQESDNDSNSSLEEEETTENNKIDSDEEEKEEEEVTRSDSSSQPSGVGTSEEDKDHSNNSISDRLMKLLMSPQIQYRLLQESKKSKTKNNNKTKPNKGNRKERKNKDLTPTKSSLKTTIPR